MDLANLNIIIYRPAGCFFATSIKRLAGTTAFAFQNKGFDSNGFHFPEKCEGQWFNRKVARYLKWMSVRYLSPDSLAVISPISNRKGIVFLDGYALGRL
ncbi:hypothetical protein [Psychromonas sp. MB-3u-54]|uniref:hypothetical protein n=1 Tax=Psychromonas sp. MB-3u-54 TaxID=2058319 RepID=UPI0012FF31DB|nr:hypothetical protein [Psychromonas sp. MB-3u-54]